jgi:general secretion pathway protein F
MPVFKYKVILSNGQIETGDIELSGKSEVLAHFEKNNSIPISIDEKTGRAGSLTDLKGLLEFKKHSRKLPLIQITNAIAMLLRAGVSLDNALDSAARAMQDEASRKFLTDISDRIRNGESFSQALKNWKAEVGAFYISMVHAGEVTGRLAESMLQIAEHLEKSKALRDNIVSALLYPIILLTVTLLSVVILMVFVIPKFKQLFEDMGGEIPAVTQLFISASDFMSDYGIFLLLPVLLLLLAMQYAHKNPAFRHRLDEKILGIPGLGKLLEKQLMSNYAKTLAMLLQNGVSMQRALRISRDVISNSYISDEIEEAEKQLNEGKTFSETIGKKFPPLVQQMLRIGESAGELDSTLDYVAQTAQEDVDRTIKRVLGVFEPVIIIFLGVLVAAVIGSIMIAVMSMNDLVIQ